MENEEPKLSDKLAVDRTVFAADRSLLAWVRTSVSLISFGFTIFKFLQYVRELRQAPTLMHSHTPRNIGLFLLLVGTAPLLLAIVEYTHTVRRLTGAGGRIALKPSLLAAAAVFLLGLTLTIALALRIDLM